MGHVIAAKCSCGYATPELAIGGGFADFMNVCRHPALCESSRHVVTINLKHARPSCPDGHEGVPIPYASGRLTGTEGTTVVSDWEKHVITNGTYLCPACGHYELRFHSLEVMFD